MKKLLSLCLILLTALAAAACAAPAEPTEVPAQPVTETQAQTADFASTVEERMTASDFYGAVYLVSKGEEIYAGGSGKADKQNDIPNTPDVVYQIASITKQFTAAAILKLCGQDKMSVDDTLSMYYPDYTAGAQITVHQLLSMTSGIPDYVRSYDENGYETESGSAAVPAAGSVSDARARACPHRQAAAQARSRHNAIAGRARRLAGVFMRSFSLPTSLSRRSSPCSTCPLSSRARRRTFARCPSSRSTSCRSYSGCRCTWSARSRS